MGGTLFGDGVRRIWGSRGVSGAPGSPQDRPVVDVDVAGDRHRAAGDMNAVGACGKERRVRGRGVKAEGDRRALSAQDSSGPHPPSPLSSFSMLFGFLSCVHSVFLVFSLVPFL